MAVLYISMKNRVVFALRFFGRGACHVGEKITLISHKRAGIGCILPWVANGVIRVDIRHFLFVCTCY